MCLASLLGNFHPSVLSFSGKDKARAVIYCLFLYQTLSVDVVKKRKG